MLIASTFERGKQEQKLHKGKGVALSDYEPLHMVYFNLKSEVKYNCDIIERVIFVQFFSL